MTQLKLDLNVPDCYEVIYVAYITTRNGRRIYAKHYGKKAFRIYVKSSKKQ